MRVHAHGPKCTSIHPSIHQDYQNYRGNQKLCCLDIFNSYQGYQRCWALMRAVVTTEPVQKLPQLPTLPKYHTIFLNKHHGTYRTTTGKLKGNCDQKTWKSETKKRDQKTWKAKYSLSFLWKGERRGSPTWI